MKYIRKLILLILFSLAYNVQAQHILSANLVINPSFEFYTQCPDNVAQITYSYPWSDCMWWGGSSDYYNYCSSSQYITIPLSFQHPRTGLGMSGIYLYGSWIYHNYREYISGELYHCLVKDKRYCGELYTSLGNYCKGAVENMGMFFSVDTLWNFDTIGTQPGLFSTNPQIENHKGIITDTVNWVKVNGSFIADGGEKYLVIGNFRDNLHTNYIDLVGLMSPYYFIDDVSVCECSFDIDLGEDRKLCDDETIILNPDLPNASYTWQDSSHAATYEVKQPGTYWVRAYIADYDITSTDTIVITAGDDSYCNPPLTIPNVITPNGDSQNDNFQIQNAESYNIALQIYNRWGNLIYETTNYQNDYNCNDCADGVYYYVLIAKSKRNGREKEYKGSLTIING
jgi:gliding motility-associated-like protein